MQQRCHVCGSEVSATAYYCPSCGASLRPGPAGAAVSGPELLPPVARPASGSWQPAPAMPPAARQASPPPEAIPPPLATALPEGAARPPRTGAMQPYSGPARGPSVVAALAPAAPAKWHFWLGLGLTMAGLALALCPLLLSLTLVIDPEIGGDGSLLSTGLFASGCLAGLLLLPGAVLLVSARPRRR